MKAIAFCTLLVLSIFPRWSAAGADVAPKGSYEDDTMYYSWPIIDYLYRTIRIDPAALDARYPGATKFAAVLKANMSERGAFSSMAFLEVCFHDGTEHIRFKKLDDMGATIQAANTLTPREVRGVAAFIEDTLNTKVVLDTHQANSKDLAAEWAFVKEVGANRLVPAKEAAKVAVGFTRLAKADDVAKLDPTTKAEVTIFKTGFEEKLFIIGRGDPLREDAVLRDFETKFRIPLKKSASTPRTHGP